MLAETIEAKDPYMRGHAQRVSFYARLLANRIGLDGEELEHVRIAGFLHDVGKVAMPSQLLLRPGALDSAERAMLEQHPEIGSGYPDGLRSAEIPHLARVVQVADAFDAMTSDRPYRKARSQELAQLELRRFAGVQFDPELAFEFDAVLEEGACEIDGALVTEIAALDTAQRTASTAWAGERH